MASPAWDDADKAYLEYYWSESTNRSNTQTALTIKQTVQNSSSNLVESTSDLEQTSRILKLSGITTTTVKATQSMLLPPCQ